MVERPAGLNHASTLEMAESLVEASFDCLVPDVRRRWNVVRWAVMVVAALGLLVILWQGGSSVPRLAAVAMLVGALMVINQRVMFDLTGRPPLERRRHTSWPVILDTLILLVMVSLTGGLHSPIIPAFPMAFGLNIITLGWSRTTRVVTALLIVGVVALAFAPRWLTGPQLPEPTYTLLLAIAMVASAVTYLGVATVHNRAMEASEKALGDVRELVLQQTCTRARELEQVAASLSHELKNPLQAIKILVQLSARDVNHTEARERLRVAEIEVDRMQSLITEYLSFSRPFEKLQPQALELGILADEVIAVLKARAAAAGVILNRRGRAHIEADSRRLREALHNLVSNALDASSPGARVEIEITDEDARVRLAVRDSGRGMAPDTLARLGTPFFTTRADGNGLGVILARAVFAQHGGSLEYESSLGQGTTATAVVPKRPIEGSADGARVGC